MLRRRLMAPLGALSLIAGVLFGGGVASAEGGATLISGVTLPPQPSIDGVVRLELQVRNDSTLAWSAQDIVRLSWQGSDGTSAAEDSRQLGQDVAASASTTLALVTLAPAVVGDFKLVTRLETHGKSLAIGDPTLFHLGGFLFQGHGNGHGLGMSQWGARGRASAGQDYRQILGDYYQGTRIDSRDTSGTVRVSLTHGPLDLARPWPRLFGPLPMIAGPVSVDGAPLQVGAGELLGFGANSAGRLVAFTVSPDGTRGNAVVILRTLTIHPTGPAGIRTNLLETMGGDFRSGAEQSRYAGVLQVIPKGGATLLPVSVLPIEEYLKGVVPAEMPAYWGTQALRAQAVAARTYALRKILLGGSGGDFDLEGNEFDQAYGGLTEARTATDDAVASTRGQVLTSGGHLIDALYMASGGGHTENSEYGFIGWNHGLRPAATLPYLRGIADPLDHAPSWQVGPFSPSAAATVLRDNGEDLGDRLLGIDVLQRGPSGRILGVRLRGSRQSDEISGPYLRFLFGLPDTLVDIVGSG